MAGVRRGAKEPWEVQQGATSSVISTVVNANDASALHKDGAETITGTKTFAVPAIHAYQSMAPLPPPAGYATGPYFGADGLPYYLTPTGVVVPLSIGDGNTALHSNPSFETVSGSTPTIWDTGFGTGTFITETTDVLAGSRSATVATAAGANFQIIISDVFTVAGGDTVSVGAWAHAVVGTPRVSIGILSAASGTPVFFAGSTTGQGSERITLASTFTKYSRQFQIPSGHTVARIYFWFDPTAAEATESRIDFTTSSRTGASTTVLPGNSWPKEACRLVTMATFTPTTGAPSTVDGVSVAVGDRILKATGSGSSTDGIWTVGTVGTGSDGVWSRASDMSTSAQSAGARTAITSGTAFGGTHWETSFKATDTFGTTAMPWFAPDVWIDYTPTWTTSGTAPVLGNGTLTGRYQRTGKTVHFQALLTAGSTTTFGTGNWRITPPFTPKSGIRWKVHTEYLDTGVNQYHGWGVCDTATQFTMNHFPTTAGNPDRAVSNTIPFAWGNTDQLTMQGTYEAA